MRLSGCLVTPRSSGARLPYPPTLASIVQTGQLDEHQKVQVNSVFTLRRSPTYLFTLNLSLQCIPGMVKAILEPMRKLQQW